MLPLVQMHHMVQPPPNFDPLPTFQQQQDHLHVQQNQLPFPHQQAYTYDHPLSGPPAESPNVPFPDGKIPRSFPIRTSHQQQLHRQRGVANVAEVSHFPDRSEHHLRRKTPNGTIDAGYDGSAVHLASGPPPLKQMILPAAPTAYAANHLRPVTVTDPNLRSRLIPGTKPRVSVPVIHDAAAESVNAYQSWALGLDMSAQPLPGVCSASSHAPGTLQYRFNSPDTSQILGSAALSRPRSTAYNANPFFPAALPTDHATPSFVPGLLQSANPWFPPPQQPSYVGPPSFHTPSPSTYDYRLCQLSNPFLRPSAHFTPPHAYVRNAYGPGFLQPAQFNLEALALESNVGGVIGLESEAEASPCGFREKALAQAHRSYVDLLTYLHHGRKTQQLRPGSALSTMSRMVVYPKPPKQPAATTAPISFYQRDMLASHKPQIKANPSGLFLGPSGSETQLPSRPNIWDGNQPDLRESMFSVTNPPGQLFPSQFGRNSPLANAKSSLEILTHLCEQSGWKWIDGVLLGGCLHYGLEHFEEAMEWFSRIISLDSE